MRNYLEHLIVLFHSCALIRLILRALLPLLLFQFVLFSFVLLRVLFSFAIIARNVLFGRHFVDFVLFAFFIHCMVFYAHMCGAMFIAFALLIRCAFCSAKRVRAHISFFSLFIDFAHTNAPNVRDILLRLLVYMCLPLTCTAFIFLFFSSSDRHFFDDRCVYTSECATADSHCIA